MCNTFLVYVAGAYHGNVAENIAKAEAVSIALIRDGWHVFTPHKNTAGYEQYEGDDVSRDTWLTMDLNILGRCDILYVMSNWRTSRGTQTEINYAINHCIPIVWEENTPPHDISTNEIFMNMLHRAREKIRRDYI